MNEITITIRVKTELDKYDAQFETAIDKACSTLETFGIVIVDAVPK